MRGRPSKASKASRTAVSAATQARAQAFLDREALLDEAIGQGVIGANLRDHYGAAFDADPTATRSYLQAQGLASAAGASEQYVDMHLSPHERKTIAAAREGRRPRFMNGGC